ncbi:MAG: helix-turn-helix domain-containing protein [Micromonospora sp.]
MRLAELLAKLGPDPLRAHALVDDGAAPISDVAIYDPVCPLGPGQVVLAVGVEAPSSQGRDLVAAAARDGAAAVVFRAGAGPDPAAATPDVSLLIAAPHLGWAQLLVLLRTLISASADDSPAGAVPTGTDGLAEAIATMVGGSVVLYDRAHRVIAYSVRGHEIDSVRRDAILGRRTPEQWIRRFTLDRSAYRTFRNPGEVVRLDSYAGLRTRLRIAVHAGGEILGEVSVAEGRRPLGPEAEAALRRAAQLAVPFLLRHRLAEDTERTARSQLLGGLLEGGPAAEPYAVELGLAPGKGLTVVGFSVRSDEPADLAGAQMFRERLVHLLSLHMGSVDPAAGVLFARPAYYALVPTPTEASRDRLVDLVEPVLGHLARLAISACAAVGPRAAGLAEVPASRRVVDDLLLVVDRRGGNAAVVTSDDLWAELVLLAAERAMSENDPRLGTHLRRLLDHDERQSTEYVKTLRIYLEEFGSISAAAERLVLHPNTLRHRLQRIAEISGLDMSDPAQRLAVALQVRVLTRRAQPGK